MKTITFLWALLVLAIFVGLLFPRESTGQGACVVVSLVVINLALLVGFVQRPEGLSVSERVRLEKSQKALRRLAASSEHSADVEIALEQLNEILHESKNL